MTNRDIKEFWAFAAEKAREAQHEPADRTSRLPEWASGLTARIASILPGLSADVALAAGGGLDVTITANGVPRHFAKVREIVAAAPAIEGLQAIALRQARRVPGGVRFGAQDVSSDRLSVHAVPVLSKFGLLLLTSGVVIDDYVLFRNIGRRLVMDLVGEERFGQFVTDVQVMDQADWASGGQGEAACPLSEIAAIVPQVAANSDDDFLNRPDFSDEPRRVA